MKKKRVYRSRRKRSLKRRMFLAVVILMLTVIGCMQFGKVSSDAHGNQEEEPAAFKYYKSIEIEDGDTLWGIAEEYMSDEYESVQDYIYELMDINHLSTDDIQSSKHLTVAYYDTEFK